MIYIYRPFLYRCWPLLLTVLALFTACDPEEEFLTGDGVDIAFSLDTLRFDTVFVEQGSATRSFRVYNRSDEPIMIDRIFIENQSGIDFRFNVDGFSGPEAKDVIIWDQDSIHVFVEVTIDPNMPESISPYVVEELITFETGRTQRSVQLEAWGQNALYLPNRFSDGVPTVISCELQNFNLKDLAGELPVVIYGALFIDSCTVEIPAGMEIYVHGGIAQNDLFGVFNDGFLFTLPNGKLRILGTPEEPVIISTDRLEEPFRDEPGQWTGIVLGPLSTGHEIRNARIRNSIFGVYVDSLATLEMSQTEIAYTASSALVGRAATIDIENCLFFDNAVNPIQVLLGGEINIDYTTVAAYGQNTASLALQNFQQFDTDGDGQADQAFALPLRARVRNSIFAGSATDQLILNDGFERSEPDFFDVRLDHTALQVEDLLTEPDNLYGDFFQNFCFDCIELNRTDTLFVNRQEDDYHLDSLSRVRNLGVFLPEITVDLENQLRMDPPDLGCFERIE